MKNENQSIRTQSSLKHLRTYLLLALLTAVLVGVGYVFIFSGMAFEQVDCGQDGGWGCINPLVAVMVLTGMLLQPILSLVPHAVLATAVRVFDLKVLAIVGPILKYVLVGILASIPFVIVFQILKRYKSAEYVRIAKYTFIAGVIVTFCLSIPDSVLSDWQSYQNANAISLVCNKSTPCEDALLSKNVLGPNGMRFPDITIESLTNFGNRGWVYGLRREEKEKYCHMQYGDQGELNYLGCTDHLGIIDVEAISSEVCTKYVMSQYTISNKTIINQCRKYYLGFVPLSREVMMTIVANEEDPRDKRGIIRPYVENEMDLADDGMVFWKRYGIGTESEFNHDGRLVAITGVGLGVLLPTVRDVATGSSYGDGINIRVTQTPLESAQRLFFNGNWPNPYLGDETVADISTVERRDLVVRTTALRYEHLRFPNRAWSPELHRIGFGIADSFFVVEVEVPEGVDGATSVAHLAELIIEYYVLMNV